MCRDWKSNNRIFFFFLFILQQNIGCALQLWLSIKGIRKKKVILSLIKAQENTQPSRNISCFIQNSHNTQAEFIFFPNVYLYNLFFLPVAASVRAFQSVSMLHLEVHILFPTCPLQMPCKEVMHIS